MSTATLPCPRLKRGQDKLTPEQEAYAQQFAQERIASMLSTTTIDEREAERHLAEAYKVAGLEPPTFRWFDSPIAFVMAHFPASVGNSVWDSVRASVGNSVWDSVRASVGNSVWDSVRASVWDSVRDSVWDSVWASVWDSVWAYYDENVHAFYRFFHEVLEANDLIHLALFNEMVSGFRLGRKEAWFVRKPVILERDEQGRLHSSTGKCMQYRDGWGFYTWHGVRCSEKIILHPESLTKEDWLREENLEIRRVIQERLGNERFVELVGGVCIDHGRRGDLIEIDIRPDPERIARFVHVKDTSTERMYHLRVPPSIKKADAGVAWTFGLDVDSYQPVQEA